MSRTIPKYALNSHDGQLLTWQALFDSVYNYFPITFRPPPNDPYGITAQDLKDRLQECISSNKYFAPHSIPSLLDKLDSTSPNVKVSRHLLWVSC